MIDSARLYFKYIGVSIRSQMQYRASFIMLTIGHFLTTGIEFLGLTVLFARFGSIEGWRLPEVAFLYGMVAISFAFADAASRGFDLFGGMVKSGDFDRLLLRPRSTALQLAGQELTLRRIGRLAQGLAAFAWAATALDVTWTLPKVALLLSAIAGGTAIFSGLVIFQATLAFWTTETLEIMNALTYGGVQTTQYPITIYRDWFQKFFIYVIPLACVNYFPALAILDKVDPLGFPVAFQYLSPLVCFAFLAVSLQAWKVGVRHYCSTGS